MARCTISKTGEYSAAHVMDIRRIEKRPERPSIQMCLPKEGDAIIFNVKNRYGDRRSYAKMEQRGCIKVTKIYPSLVTGLSYQFIPGSNQEIIAKIALPISDFMCGNVLFIKTKETVYCNSYSYEDWKLLDTDNKEEMVARLHPYLRKIVQEI